MIPTTVKAGVAAALALAAVPAHPQPGVAATTPAAFLAALLVQALVGFTLGMFTMMLVNALQAAGQFVDLFAGFSLSRSTTRSTAAVRDLRPLLRARRDHAAVHDATRTSSS